jgi:hypothetical protein
MAMTNKFANFNWQVNFPTALTSGQILQSWWSPKWATSTGDIYTNFICQATQGASATSYKLETWNTVGMLSTTNAARNAAASFTGV